MKKINKHKKIKKIKAKSAPLKTSGANVEPSFNFQPSNFGAI